MKLEVEMYCYDKTNRKLGIGKIVGFIENNNAVIEYKKSVVLTSMGNIVASHKPIDLVETGDYVNGIEVTEIMIKMRGEQGIFGLPDCYGMFVGEIHIRSIVTKEQFDSMKYVVGE